jgi:hypothetical protein
MSYRDRNDPRRQWFVVIAISVVAIESGGDWYKCIGLSVVEEESKEAIL